MFNNQQNNQQQSRMRAGTELPPQYQQRYANAQPVPLSNNAFANNQQQQQQFMNNARSSSETLRDIYGANSNRTNHAGGINWEKTDNSYINSFNKAMNDQSTMEVDQDLIIKEACSSLVISVLQALRSFNPSNRVYGMFYKGLNGYQYGACRDNEGKYAPVMNFDGSPLPSLINKAFLSVVESNNEIKAKIIYDVALLFGFNYNVVCHNSLGDPNADEKNSEGTNFLINMIPDFTRSVMNIYMYAWIKNTTLGSRDYNRTDEREKQFIFNEANKMNECLKTVYGYFGFSANYSLNEYFGESTHNDYMDFSNLTGAKVQQNNQNIFYQNPSSEMDKETRAELMRFVDRQNEQYRNGNSTYTPPKPNREVFVEPVIDYSNCKATDVTRDNIDSVNMGKFFTYLKDGWYIVNNNNWFELKQFFIPKVKGDNEFPFAENYEPYIRLVKLNLADRSIPYETMEIHTETMNKKRFYLSNPSELLPLMIEDEATKEIDVVYEVDLDEYMSKKEKSLSVDLESIEPIYDNVLAFSNKLIYTNNQKEIKGLLNNAYYKEFKDYTDDKIITLTLPFRIYSKVENINNVDLKIINDDFEFLKINNTFNPNNYFEYIKYIDRQLKISECLSNDVKNLIIKRCSEVIDNWFIEERGYGTRFDNNSLNIDNIFNAREGLIDFLLKYDPDSYLVLTNDKEVITKLKKRMEMFADDECMETIIEREKFLIDLDNPLLANSFDSKGLYIIKDIVFSMSNNVNVPQYKGEHKYVDKYSLHPTKIDVFKKIHTRYENRLRDPEIMSTFENAKDELWSNRFSGFDENVMVSRLVDTNHDLIFTKYL